MTKKDLVKLKLKFCDSIYYFTLIWGKFSLPEETKVKFFDLKKIFTCQVSESNTSRADLENFLHKMNIF